MMGFFSIFRRKRREAIAEQPVISQAPNIEKPSRFLGGVPEKAHDYLMRRDGERVGFRKPVQE
jgi:hypothetical protein